MALSASIDFSMDVRAIIKFALQKLRVLADSETASASQAEDARLELSTILKEWQKHRDLWRRTQGTLFTFAASTYSYTCSPVPHRILDARYRDTSGNDLPMELLSENEYYDLPDKSTTGQPTSYYADYQRAATTFLIWQAPSSITTETIQLTYEKKYDDVDTLDDDIEVRSEHLGAIGWTLAERLGPGYGMVGSPNYAKIEAIAFELRETMQDEDREDEVRFVPGFGSGYPGSETPY